MLLELLGRGTIKRCVFNDNNTTTIDIEFNEVIKKGESSTTTTSYRTIVCASEHNNYLRQYQSEDMTGWFVDFSAKAETVGRDLLDRYRATYIQIIGNATSAETFEACKASLRGAGEIKSILAVDKTTVKFCLSNSETQGNRTATGSRWVSVQGHAAKWYLENKDKLVGSWLDFIADARTKFDEDAYDTDEETFVLNHYIAKRHSVVWNNNTSVKE